ncbi:hypothetical protein H4S02_011151, partial [Coemansia sp. RSA 2611]
GRCGRRRQRGAGSGAADVGGAAQVGADSGQRRAAAGAVRGSGAGGHHRPARVPRGGAGPLPRHRGAPAAAQDIGQAGPGL